MKRWRRRSRGRGGGDAGLLSAPHLELLASDTVEASNLHLEASPLFLDYEASIDEVVWGIPFLTDPISTDPQNADLTGHENEFIRARLTDGAVARSGYSNVVFTAP